jgi:hypothetical protein
METLQRTANRGSISTGYDIDNSLKFEADNSEYLKANNTFASTTPTSRQKGTVSFWIKRTEIGNGVSGKQMYIFASSDSSRYSNLGFDEFDNLTVFSGDSSWNSVSPYTYNKFRDTSAWYHIVIRYDTTDSTASNRLRVYSNGTEVSWVTAPNITQDGVMTYSGMNGPCWHSWGTIYSYFTPDKFFSGYLAEAHFVDGQSLAPTEFGEYDSTSGIWKPKAYDGTYGNCGYYLDFADSGNLGDDESGNGFDFDENNITAADQATDTPTNNFCIGNALVNFAPGGQTLTEGGTKFANPSGQNWQSITGTFGLTSGKWYWEFKINGTGAFVGISDVEDSIVPQRTDGYFLGYGDNDSATTNSLGMYSANGVIYNDNTGATGNSYGTSDIVGVALDMDNEKIYFAVNNTYVNSGDPAAGTNGAAWNSAWTDTVHPAFSCAQNNNVAVNYGGYTTISISSAASDANGYGNFEYAPPSGYYALCTKNLAEYG